MRDFRDAKVMAQTLRDVIKPKATISHSESLELIAKILGFQNWNVLAAAIQSDDRAASGPGHAAGASDRQEIQVDAAILDRYVGFYELDGQGVMTITRNGAQLVSRLTGQPSVPLFAESPTKFFARIVDAQLSFLTDASGMATSLTIHQNGGNTPMKRIDAREAQRIEDLVAEKLKNRAPSVGTETALRRVIEGLRTGQPNYAEMGPALADITRQQLPAFHRDISEAGSIRSIEFLGTGNLGVDVYCVQHEHRMLYWRISVDSRGVISNAWGSPGL